MILFCPACNTYFPIGDSCPACGHERTRLHTPVAPGRAVWLVKAPGRVAQQLALAEIDGMRVLLAAWGHVPRLGDTRPQDGGVVAVRLGDGEQLWAHSLGLPVEGGVTVAGDRVLIGCGQRGMGGGEGWVAALDLATGEERWRTRVGGNVRSTPVIADTWVFATADDGQLSCLDLRHGRMLWQKRAYPRPVPMPASPVLLKTRQALDAVIVGTYGSRHGREPGLITAFDLRGRQRWQQAADGYVRGTPALDGDRLYVTTYGVHPPRGMLSAYRARTGRPLWSQPFVVQPKSGERRTYNFSASPLVQGKTVYAGSLDHHIYAISADSGELLWRVEVGGGIATQPAWVEGLVVFGANDGRVYAVDPVKQAVVWEYDLGAAALTNPLIVDGNIIIAAENGRLAILPWHLGHYDWAARRLEAEDRCDEAGDAWALAAFHHPQHEETYRTKAKDAWGRAGQWQKQAYFLLATGEKSQAVDVLMASAQKLRLRAREQAVSLFWQAHRLAFSLKRFDAARIAAEALGDLAKLPRLQIEPRNVGSYDQWQEGRLTLRIENVGNVVAPDGIHFWLGGGLQAEVSYHIPGEIHPGQVYDIPISIIPTARESTLVIEYRYATGRQDIPSLRGALEVDIRARPPRQKPMQIGDVQQLHVTIAATTAEGIAIETGDVALFKNQGDIGDVHIEGDAGAIINRDGDMGDVSVDGDVGYIKNHSTPDSMDKPR